MVNGGIAGGNHLTDSWAWDGSSWSPLEGPAFGRINTLCAYDPANDVMLIPGGNTAGGLNFQTSVRNGLDWSHPQTNFPGVERVGMALAYDPVRKATHLDGGSHLTGTSLFWDKTTDS